MKTEKSIVEQSDKFVLGHVSILLIVSFSHSDVQCVIRISGKDQSESVDLEEIIV